MSSDESADFDESKLSGEDGEIVLLRWLAAAEKDLKKNDTSNLKASQAIYESKLLKVITAAAPYPPPGRPFRNLAARCLVLLYTRGETRTLFDTLQTLMKVVSDYKSNDPDIKKVAAFYCIGELMAAFGSQVMSFMAEIATVSLKTLRSSSNSVLLRFHALMTLRKSFSTAGKALTDSAVKDVAKQSRNALSDKSLVIQRAAADILIELYPIDDGNRSVSDVESTIVICGKNLENADQETRRSLARLAGHMLASTQTLRILPPPDPSKGKKKDKNEDEADLGDQPSALAAAEASKPILPPAEMLGLLSAQFNRLQVSRKARIGFFDFYTALLTTLGSGFIEANYAVILKHFFTEIACANRPNSTRDDGPVIKKLVGTILRDLIGVRFLSEQGQISAIQELSKSYLKKWPALMPGQTAPDDAVLFISLKEVAGLVRQLGNAPPPVQDALADPLVTLLSHPNQSTRVAAAWALRNFCYATPLRIPKVVLNVLELLQRDTTSLATPTAPSDIAERALGHAYGLAALFAIIPERPLYVSADLSAKVFDTATQLLRKAAEHDMHVATVEIEVSWTIVTALMSLGPNFVRSHLPQLMVLWRNALPKPTSKDSDARGAAEWTFLLHVKACALGSIRGFLKHNTPVLVTLDVARRIASLLGNALAFANAFVSAQPSQLSVASSAPGMPQVDGTAVSGESFLRRRVYQCFTVLGFSSITDSMQTSLLQSTSSLFASAEGYVGSALQAAIASAGSFTSLWNMSDGYAYGVTSILIQPEIDTNGSDADLEDHKDRLNRDSIEAKIDDLMNQPRIGSCEHDPLVLCEAQTGAAETEWPEPPPVSTSVVDAALELYASLLPLQDTHTCHRIVNETIDFYRSPKLEKNAGRKAAVSVNTTIAFALALRSGTTSGVRSQAFGTSQVQGSLSSYLKEMLISNDAVLRSASSETLGRLASLSGTNFLTSQIKMLVDQVVSNRDPYARAGCALAFGAIYTHVGGLAAGPLLKTTINVLMSLGNDPHPVVHFWALSALSQVINAASLAYMPFVSSTLGMLLKIYLMESHEPEGGTVINSNMKGSYPTYQVVCRLLDAIVAVLGPDLQESERTRNLTLNMVHVLFSEPDEGICVEAIKCIQHLLMFTPQYVDAADLLDRLRAHLASPRRPLKFASINALYQLVQKDALAISKLGGDKLVEELFGMLDRDPSIDGVRNVISSWLEQTVIYNPSAWIDLCQRIMARTTASQQASDMRNAGFGDDEGQSLNVGAAQEQTSTTSLTSRWRTQLFALRCLHRICRIVAESGRREHLDIPFAKAQKLLVAGLLVSRVSDLIKMAFTASAAYVTEIRLEGLEVLRDVIEVFAKSPDPDYEDCLLLEQYQAPITAALTPAFSSDSTPEILSSAIQVSAVFVGSGIVKDVGRMGRILRLLTSALDQSKEAGMLSLGNAGELSPNASVMLRISALAAWAELEVFSNNQAYLKDVVNPHRKVLISLWISSLRDYASIKGESEVFQDGGSAATEAPYASLGREILLPYYDNSWPIVLHAVAGEMKTGDSHVLLTMDGLDDSDGKVPPPSYRDEPTALFFALFGLIYEALAASSADATPSPKMRHNALISLEALKSLVKPQFSGKALLDPPIFSEFTSLCYRMAMTESAAVQVRLVEVISVFATTQAGNMTSLAKVNGRASASGLPDSPLTNCIRLCAHILRNGIAGYGNARTFSHDPPADRIELIRASFTAFLAIGNAFSPNVVEEVRAVAVSLYADLLRDEKSDIDLAGPTLPSLKAILDNAPSKADTDVLSRYNRLIHGLFSSCIVNIDEMSGRQGVRSRRKVTNNLLAAVLVLTVVPPYVGFSDAALEHFFTLISQKLLDREVSLTAAHCAKTIILAGCSGNVILKRYMKNLLSGTIEYIAAIAALTHDAQNEEENVRGIDELFKAFSGFFTSVPADKHARALGILLPTLTLLLDPSIPASSSTTTNTKAMRMHNLAVTQVLSFARTSPGAFKEATEKMDANAKETLESSVRRALGASASAASSAAAKPQISLKAF